MIVTSRPPAVAGAFYPASAEELAGTIDRLIGEISLDRAPRPKALIVPHAGYIYSGAIAASGFARVAGAEFTRVVLLGPAHRVAVRGLVWPGTTHLATPLGDVEVDVEALQRVPEVVAHPAAHAREHSLEVELPFVQRLLPRAKVVPIAASYASAEQVGRVLDALWGGPETLIVISSDLSHYHPYRDGRAIDERTAAKIVALDTALTGEEACGCTGINGLAWAGKRRGLRIELLDLRSSGDTAGTRDEVVGYGAFAGYEGAA
jgi:AmmeMemoRadiSam system protein B